MPILKTTSLSKRNEIIYGNNPRNQYKYKTYFTDIFSQSNPLNKMQKTFSDNLRKYGGKYLQMFLSVFGLMIRFCAHTHTHMESPPCTHTH